MKSLQLLYARSESPELVRMNLEMDAQRRLQLIITKFHTPPFGYRCSSTP